MDFTARFKALHYKEENVGKLISFSKRKLTWEFKMNSKHCFLTLKVSKITNNYSVELNKQLLYKGNKSYDENFEFKFKIEGIMLSIKMLGASYVLYIQHIPFKEFYEGEKGKKTRLVRPEPVLNSEDFDIPTPEKRFKSMNAKPVKNRLVDNVMNNSTPLNLLKANKDGSSKEMVEEWVKDKRKQEEAFSKNAKYVISEQSIEEDINPFADDETRVRGKTYQFNGDSKPLEMCKELDSESDSAKNDSIEVEDPTLKESMDVVVYPCDFDDRNDNTEKVITVLYGN